MFEAYSVAVKLTLINHAAAGLTSLIGGVEKLNAGFLRAQGGAEALETRLKGLRTLAIGGFAMGAAGVGILHTLKAPLEEAKNFQTEVAKFQTLGFGDIINNQA